MALVSDYSNGTITVAANGTVVTGSGTAWAAAGFREGDELWANGYAGIIQSVDSNTQLTLAQPWRGGALNGSPYRLRYQGDGSRLTAMARQLLDALGASGNIPAFAALGGAADTLPFFTGAGTMSLAAVTAFARSVLDDANAAAAQATLGVYPSSRFYAEASPGSVIQLGYGNFMTVDFVATAPTVQVEGGSWISRADTVENVINSRLTLTDLTVNATIIGPAQSQNSNRAGAAVVSPRPTFSFTGLIIGRSYRMALQFNCNNASGEQRAYGCYISGVCQ